jgi:hypothetical protein
MKAATECGRRYAQAEQAGERNRCTKLRRFSHHAFLLSSCADVNAINAVKT